MYPDTITMIDDLKNSAVMIYIDSNGGHYYMSNGDNHTALSVDTNDIRLLGTGDTWDGTHTSLKDAIAAGGGGGTTVIANPSGTATDDLTKIQIGTTIYDIPGGGSGLTPVELTKAQYDALTTEQKNDPTKIYFVTDYNPNGSGDRINSTAAINTGGGDVLMSSLYATGTDIVHS